MRSDGSPSALSCLEALSALGDLANNLRWSWHPPTQDVFAEVDPGLWLSSGKDPVKLLGAVPKARFEELAADAGFVERLGAAERDLAAYLSEDRWYQTPRPGRPARDRLLLARVRHHRRAAAVLRRPRHPRR